MKIDIWSDIVCPFCHLGRARLEQALEGFPHRDEVEIQWHSFELDRKAPAQSGESLAEHLAGKYGMTHEQADAEHESLAAQAKELGIDFNWRNAKPGNTFDAHRVFHFAEERGQGTEALDRLMRAYFTEGEPIGDRATLVRLAGEVGLDEAEVAAMLEGDEYGNHVRSDEATAQMIGVQGVPFFVFDRKYGVSGAQPVEVFTQALDQSWATRHEEPEPAMATGCGDGGCGNEACGGGVCAR